MIQGMTADFKTLGDLPELRRVQHSALRIPSRRIKRRGNSVFRQELRSKHVERMPIVHTDADVSRSIHRGRHYRSLFLRLQHLHVLFFAVTAHACAVCSHTASESSTFLKPVRALVSVESTEP